MYCNQIQYTGFIGLHRGRPTLSKFFIIDLVQKYTSISLQEMKSKTRKREVSEARQVSMYFIRKYTKTPLKNIGKIFNRDHSTVIYSRITVENIIQTDKKIKQLVTKIQNRINESI